MTPCLSALLRERPPGIAVGVEYATIFSALGVPVTILDAASQLAAMMDDEISARPEQVFAARGNRIILATGVVSVHREGDDLAVDLTDGRRPRLDALLFAAGRSVSTEGLGLDKTGVEADQRGRIVVDAERRTTCPWVFAAGDVTGPALASVAIEQGRQALCAALELDFSLHVSQVPAAAIYGLPEVARAGKSEEDCAAEQIPYVCGRCELGAIPRGVIAGQPGLLKLVFHAGTGVLLGVHASGDPQPALIGRPRISTTSAPVVPTSMPDSAGSTRTITPPLPLAATATLPPMRKARPPNIFFSVRPGSSATRARMRSASRSS
jgi:NAD(P) transhydrogenase